MNKLNVLIILSLLTPAIGLSAKINTPDLKQQMAQHSSCVFCKIAAGQERKTKIVYEDADFVAFESPAPRYPSHFLIIPKKHLMDMRALKGNDLEIMAGLAEVANKLSTAMVAPGDFSFNINNGSSSAQTIFHIHAHFYGSTKLK